MGEHPTPQFDFDDWAGLYLENPQEFEARRSAALMIELTRGSTEGCAAGQTMLDAYERQVHGCDTQQRMQVAALMMAESVGQLNTELMLLKQALQNVEEELEVKSPQ